MGTPNLSGSFSGIGRILIRASSLPNLAGQTLAATLCEVEWTWNFTNHTMTIANGNLFPSVDAPQTNCIDYEIEQSGGGAQPIPFVDNLDGTYTVPYRFIVYPHQSGTPLAQEDTTIRLEITHLRACATPPWAGDVDASCDHHGGRLLAWHPGPSASDAAVLQSRNALLGGLCVTDLTRSE